MPLNLHKIAHCRGWQPVTLVAMACISLASCGRGPGAGHPDLVVDSPAVSDDRPAAGARFTFSATVHNAGSGSAAATTLRVFRSSDTTDTPSATEVGTATVTELRASGSVRAPVELTAPSRSGTYDYRSCVDAVKGESDTANNCSEAVPITVPEEEAPPLPDLVLEAPEVSDAEPTAGAGFTLSVKVRNAGSEAAVETEVRFHRSTDQEITPSDPEVGTATIAELAASGSRVASVELTAPSAPATYYYGACVVAADRQSGTAYVCSASVRVTVRESQSPPQPPARRAPGPDLTVQLHGVGEISSRAGVFQLIGVFVYNAGSVAAAETRLSYYRSRDATITRSDEYMGFNLVRALAPSEREYVGKYVMLTGVDRMYYYGVCVDAVAGESDTANNCRMTKRVTVQVPPPDLVALLPHSAYPARPAAGAHFLLQSAVHNKGESVSGVTLRYYRSNNVAFSSSGTQVAVVQVGYMTAGSSLSMLKYLDTPSAIGTYYYRACVDVVAGESDTSNNCSSPVTVGITHDKPNLVIESTRRWNPKSGKLMMLIKVENVGSRIDEETRVLRFYRSTDATITTSDTEIGSAELGWGLVSDGFDFFYDTVTLTLPPTPGTYYFGACVDVAAGELDTTDNCSGTPLSFQR